MAAAGNKPDKGKERHENKKDLEPYFFVEAKGGQRKQAERTICYKKVYRDQGLCYSVKEANCRSGTDFAYVLTVGTDRQAILANQGFNIRRGCIVAKAQEMSANLYSDGKIDLISMLGVKL